MMTITTFDKDRIKSNCCSIPTIVSEKARVLNENFERKS